MLSGIQMEKPCPEFFTFFSAALRPTHVVPLSLPDKYKKASDICERTFDIIFGDSQPETKGLMLVACRLTFSSTLYQTLTLDLWCLYRRWTVSSCRLRWASIRQRSESFSFVLFCLFACLFVRSLLFVCMFVFLLFFRFSVLICTCFSTQKSSLKHPEVENYALHGPRLTNVMRCSIRTSMWTR